MSDKPDDCEGCGRETDALEYFDNGETAWLCELCASTAAGNAVLYPRQHPDSELLKTMVTLTWAVIDELRKRGEQR